MSIRRPFAAAPLDWRVCQASSNAPTGIRTVSGSNAPCSLSALINVSIAAPPGADRMVRLFEQRGYLSCVFWARSASVSHLSAISMKSDLRADVRASSASRMHSAALLRNWSRLGESASICADMGTDRAHRQRYVRHATWLARNSANTALPARVASDMVAKHSDCRSGLLLTAT